MSYKDAIFGIVHDDVIRAASRSCKSPEDACDMGSLASAIHALTEEIGTEQKFAMPAGFAMQQPTPKCVRAIRVDHQ